MPLTGLDVYKLLPRTNCRDCGVPTCLAFAMQIASGKAEPDACPHMDTRARERLALASEPPIRVVQAGPPEHRVTMGGETVVYRHEKKFVNQPPVFVYARNADEHFDDRLAMIERFEFERVGQKYRAEGFAAEVGSKDQVVRALRLLEKTTLTGFLVAREPAVFTEIESLLAKSRPLIGFATAATAGAYLTICRASGCACVLKAQDTDEAARLVSQFAAGGVRDVLISFDAPPAQQMKLLTGTRRKSVMAGERSLGRPTLVVIEKEQGAVLLAASYIARYASAIVVPCLKQEEMLALLTWRHDLYSDPERPVQVESKLYSIGEAGPDSPLYITTNFSLTYFSVENEVAASRVPAYILPVDTDGTSVLTAWAAGKLTVEKIASSMESIGAETASRRRLAVLPGHIRQMSRKLEQATGWRVVAGPQEASGIPEFAQRLEARGV